jgi:hypothetical protein
LRVGPSFISKLERSGALHVNGNGKFDLGYFIIAWGNYKEARVTSTKLALQEKLMQAKLAKLEREELQWRGEVMPVRYIANWETVDHGELASVLHNLGNRITRDLKLRAEIDNHVGEALKLFEKRIRELLGKIKPGQNPQQLDASDDHQP